MNPPGKIRARTIETLKRKLVRTQMPRVQMTVLLLGTGAAGFLSSFVMLHIGVGRMGIRYPAAVGLAYFVFFLLLRAWLEYQRSQMENRMAGSNFLDGLDLGGCGSRGSGGAAEPFRFGGGSTGGGGAGGHFDAPTGHTEVVIDGVDAGSGVIPDLPLDLDDGWILLLPFIAVTAALLASLYIVYSAPTLFAEVLLDGVLVTGLYARLQGLDRKHWMADAVQHTWVPVLIVALVFFVAGLGMDLVVPDAHSLSQVWRHVMGR